MIRFILSVAVLVVGQFTSASVAVFPLKIADKGRYFVGQDGKPFLVVGDTAWSLIVQLGEADIDRYLEDRQKRGFNSIIVNLIEHKFCTVPPKARSGLAPFMRAGDLSTPNPEYFNFARKVVKKAYDHGIVVWLFPAYLGYGGGDEGFFQEMRASGKAAVRKYGRFVGRQFLGSPNVIWCLGGDYVPGETEQWTVREVAEGIRQEDRSHLTTGHGSRDASAVAAFGNQKWLTVNTIYAGEKTPVESMHTEYERRPSRPFVLIESIYEGEHNSTPDQIRRQAYWAMLGGACGQFLGNNPIWHFDGPGLFTTKTTWKEALSSAGSSDMTHLRDLLPGMAWYELHPEQDHAIVRSGYGNGLATAVTARTPDKNLSVTYLPSTGIESRSLSIDFNQFSGPVKARWYNPTDGRWKAISDVPNRRSGTVHTPGDNGTKSNDWLLVLEVPSQST